MSITSRLEKIRFLVDEMQIAFHLAKHAPDTFEARTLARHVLIRAENFIAHVRGLRKPLNLAGYDTRNFHAAKENYARIFDEYFQVSRDKLGAHVQDFDFGKRLELWNDIEAVKLSFFVDGALEIYRGLADLNLPGYVAYVECPELSDPALTLKLHEYQRSKADSHAVEIGVDSLALTRDNATATLNFTPVHSRAGQLALIRRWIGMQMSLIERLSGFKRVERVLKERVLTDIVSFCDCLITRPVAPNAPQAMDGLDKLIVASGQSDTPITGFIAASNFDAALATTRAVRDEIGAHLEIDQTMDLAAILADFDSYDFEGGYRFFGLVEATFIKACMSVLFLRLYVADGQRVYGVSPGPSSAIPFSDETPKFSGPAPHLLIDDDVSYRLNLAKWFDGDENQKGDARNFFWQAFSSSSVVEKIEEREYFGQSWRGATHEYRNAHGFLEAFLAGYASEKDFYATINLMMMCRGGWPYPLAEILVRVGPMQSESRQALICYALGEIGSWPHDKVAQFLIKRSTNAKWGLRLPAVIARYRLFLKSEGQYRINHQGRTIIDYDTFVMPLVEGLPFEERLIILLAFASLLSGHALGSFTQPFADNYTALQVELETLCLSFLKGGASNSQAGILSQLVGTHDYVGVALVIAIDLEDGPRKALKDGLINVCCNGTIIAARHDQSQRHVAMCFLLGKHYDHALEQATSIAAKNPDDKKAQLLVTQILAEAPGHEDRALTQLAHMRAIYKFDAAEEVILRQLEQEIAERRAKGSIP